MIKPYPTAFIAVLLSASLAQAQQLPELLQTVDDAKARQLVEYNSPWLQAELYSARRSRVVLVDTDILMRDDDFTITPFEDVGPLRITKDVVLRYDESVSWAGSIVSDLPVLLRNAKQPVHLHAVAWDTDDAGRASVSSDNRFEFAPQWTFDFFDRPVFESPDGQEPTGPPPQTPQQIERHKHLLSLRKHAFYSVNGDIQMIVPVVQYRLVPLRNTPKYSVFIEVDPEKVVPLMRERPLPGETVNPTPADRVKLADYENFVRTLPPDRNVPIVEDVP